jgi:hypothetical protein
MDLESSKHEETRNEQSTSVWKFRERRHLEDRDADE